MFFSELFFILLIIFACFWRNHLSKTCDEPIVWAGNLCSTDECILSSLRNLTFQFLQKHIFITLVAPSGIVKSQFGYKWFKSGSIQSKFVKIYFFLSLVPAILRCYPKRDWKPRVCSRCKAWSLWLAETQRYRVIVFLTNFSDEISKWKKLLIMPLLEKIAAWVLFTLSTSCSIKVH